MRRPCTLKRQTPVPPFGTRLGLDSDPMGQGHSRYQEPPLRGELAPGHHLCRLTRPGGGKGAVSGLPRYRLRPRPTLQESQLRAPRFQKTLRAAPCRCRRLDAAWWPGALLLGMLTGLDISVQQRLAQLKQHQRNLQDLFAQSQDSVQRVQELEFMLIELGKQIAGLEQSEGAA